MKNPLEPLGVVLFCALWLAVPVVGWAIAPPFLRQAFLAAVFVTVALFLFGLVAHVLVRLPAWIQTGAEILTHKLWKE